jgi:hypothetical protein
MVTTLPFTFEEDLQLKRRSRILAAIISGALLLVLLIVFIFWKFYTPIPAIPPDPEPIAVEIGFVDGSGGNAVDQGGGSNGNTGTPGSQPADVHNNPTPSNPTSNGSITDANSDNPSAPSQTNPNQPSKEMLAALENLGNNSGIDQGPGHGDPGTGTPGGHNGTSQLGSGNRVRHILSKPEIVNPTQTEGKVVVNVYVDRTGKVVKTEVEPNGTTTLNPTLRATATQSAYKIVFDADPTGPEILLLPIDIYFTLK